ncbi:MAG: hypothetical protein HRU15_04445 [Planctomycetes bacterium]|nr:hypothetical protein [Planctomycetota bacterium]
MKGSTGLVSDLVGKYRVDRSYMRKHLNLALLPPDQIEQIMDHAIDISAAELFAQDVGIW